jgi:hypothetical protein
MSDEKFTENLLRAIAAQLQTLTTMTAAREMFGRGYFSLGAGEQAAADQAAWNLIGANYQNLTREALAGQSPKEPIGFRTAAE